MDDISEFLPSDLKLSSIETSMFKKIAARFPTDLAFDLTQKSKPFSSDEMQYFTARYHAITHEVANKIANDLHGFDYKKHATELFDWFGDELNLLTEGFDPDATVAGHFIEFCIAIRALNEAVVIAARETRGWIRVRNKAETVLIELGRLLPRRSRESFQGDLLEDVAEWHRDGVPGWKIQILVIYHFLVYTRAAVWGGVTLLGAKLLGWLGLG